MRSAAAVCCYRMRSRTLKVGDQIIDLSGVEAELGHRGMPRHDPFGQRLGEALDRIALVKCSERRRNPKRAFTNRPDRVALGAIRLGEGAAPLYARLDSKG